jgi:hypothetical protein
MLADYGFKDAKDLDKYSAEKILDAAQNIDLKDELTVDGNGSDFANLWMNNKGVDAQEFIRWQFVEGQGNRAIDNLEQKFKEFTIIEHYGNSWRLKVSRDNYSIGFLFGMMEDIQTEFDISEYSVAQTTLE